MFYHCSDDGYIVSTETRCEQPSPVVVPSPERDYILTKVNLSATQLVNWIITHDHERMANARKLAISALNNVFRDAA